MRPNAASAARRFWRANDGNVWREQPSGALHGEMQAVGSTKTVVRGTAEVTLDGNVTYIHENESIYLPIGCTHRMANPGKIDLELIEVQVGSYTGEDDIVRIEDIYAGACWPGRTSET